MDKLFSADFDDAKLQLRNSRVTYNLWDMEARDNKKKVIPVMEIYEIFDSQSLARGRAGRLKGVLMFGASQPWGKVGRVYMLVLLERQYDKKGRGHMTEAIGAVLRGCKRLAL